MNYVFTLQETEMSQNSLVRSCVVPKGVFQGLFLTSEHLQEVVRRLVFEVLL